MSILHRVGSQADGADRAVDPVPASPPAVRRRVSRWGDPRLWMGVVLVLVSVVVGAKVLAAADHAEAVWRVQRDVLAGSTITAADVQLTRVHFSDDSARQQYLSATAPLPAGARLTRDLSAGELVAVSAITTDETPAPRQLPLGVAASGVPAGLSAGDRVDVWAVAASDQPVTKPVKVLDDVAVTAVSGAGPGGLGTDREILVALAGGTDVAHTLATLNGASIVLIQNGA